MDKSRTSNTSRTSHTHKSHIENTWDHDSDTTDHKEHTAQKIRKQKSNLWKLWKRFFFQFIYFLQKMFFHKMFNMRGFPLVLQTRSRCCPKWSKRPVCARSSSDFHLHRVGTPQSLRPWDRKSLFRSFTTQRTTKRIIGSFFVLWDFPSSQPWAVFLWSVGNFLNLFASIYPFPFKPFAVKDHGLCLCVAECSS